MPLTDIALGMIFITTQIESNRKFMQQNLHLSYPNAIDKPNISLQKFVLPKFAVFTFDTKNISVQCATRRKVHNSKKLS